MHTHFLQLVAAEQINAVAFNPLKEANMPFPAIGVVTP
jgi:hypothetical protein